MTVEIEQVACFLNSIHLLHARYATRQAYRMIDFHLMPPNHYFFNSCKFLFRFVMYRNNRFQLQITLRGFGKMGDGNLKQQLHNSVWQVRRRHAYLLRKWDGNQEFFVTPVTPLSSPIGGPGAVNHFNSNRLFLMGLTWYVNRG